MWRRNMKFDKKQLNLKQLNDHMKEKSLELHVKIEKRQNGLKKNKPNFKILL